MTVSMKVVLNDNDIPRQWYNIQADLPHPLPPPSAKPTLPRKKARERSFS